MTASITHDERRHKAAGLGAARRMIEVNFSVGQKGPGGTRFGKLLVGLKELQILNTERPLAMRHLDSFLKSFLA